MNRLYYSGFPPIMETLSLGKIGLGKVIELAFVGS